MPTESDFLTWLHTQQRASDLIHIGSGDDLAALHWDSKDLLLVGIDQLLDGVHFDSKVHSPRAIGRKAMNRNLSDCAAMACLPVCTVVSVALPRSSGMEFAKELYLGLRDAADPFDCAIVGGDTSAWDGALAMSVAIVGKSAGIEPITRSGARVGDTIYVTGALGGSIRGRHLDFIPQIKLARELAQTGAITAMIDISDGLSRDLRTICTMSKVGAVIESDLIPIHPDAILQLQQDGQPALEHALSDGEDHELLFTARKAIDHPQVIRIGSITESGGVQIDDAGKRTPLPPGGWDPKF